MGLWFEVVLVLVVFGAGRFTAEGIVAMQRAYRNEVDRFLE